jgi:hypothetical protein
MNGDPVEYNLDHTYVTRIQGRGAKLKLQIGDARRGSWPDNSKGLTVLITHCKVRLS